MTRADLELALVDVALAWARADRRYKRAIEARARRFTFGTDAELVAASREVDEADEVYSQAARDLLAAVEADTIKQGGG